MISARRAVIDVGTNSVKLLVADVSGHDVQPVFEDSKQTRLGRGFYESHRLQPEPVEQTAWVVAKFATDARKLAAQSMRVIATSAARDAVNPGDLTSAIERESGLKVEIIPGEQEAEWVFQGVTTDPKLLQQPLLLVDVGGGSTEFILGQGEHIHFRHSFPLGAVRLLEKFPPSDPPTRTEFGVCRRWIGNFLKTEVCLKLKSELRVEAKLDPVGHQVWLVGTGGTASILALMEAKMGNFDRERIEGTRLSVEQVHGHLERLWALPLAERQKIAGLPPKRADVILPGVAIYVAVMEEFGFRELRISTRGLRFAAIMEAT